MKPNKLNASIIAKRITKLVTACFMFCFFLVGCQKDADVSPVDVTFKMISDKTWYLSYTKEGTALKTYIGQPTYFITLLSNNTTRDSDGLTGSYTLSSNGSKLKLSVQAKTRNGSSVSYSYNVVSVGSNNMVLSFSTAGQSSLTTLYYSIKQ